MRWTLLAVLLLCPGARAAEMPPNMEKYYLVLLKRPANPPQGSMLVTSLLHRAPERGGPGRS